MSPQDKIDEINTVQRLQWLKERRAKETIPEIQQDIDIQIMICDKAMKHFLCLAVPKFHCPYRG